jgi:hypothetical protein
MDASGQSRMRPTSSLHPWSSSRTPALLQSTQSERTLRCAWAELITACSDEHVRLRGQAHTHRGVSSVSCKAEQGLQLLTTAYYCLLPRVFLRSLDTNETNSSLWRCQGCITLAHQPKSSLGCSKCNMDVEATHFTDPRTTRLTSPALCVTANSTSHFTTCQLRGRSTLAPHAPATRRGSTAAAQSDVCVMKSELHSRKLSKRPGDARATA